MGSEGNKRGSHTNYRGTRKDLEQQGTKKEKEENRTVGVPGGLLHTTLQQVSESKRRGKLLPHNSLAEEKKLKGRKG